MRDDEVITLRELQNRWHVDTSRILEIILQNIDFNGNYRLTPYLKTRFAGRTAYTILYSDENVLRMHMCVVPLGHENVVFNILQVEQFEMDGALQKAQCVTPSSKPQPVDNVPSQERMESQQKTTVAVEPPHPRSRRSTASEHCCPAKQQRVKG